MIFFRSVAFPSGAEGSTTTISTDACAKVNLEPTYRYILRQSVRHGVVKDPHDYPHTRIHIEMDRALKRALELGAFITDVPYKRYDDK
jgi:hypothetical protein